MAQLKLGSTVGGSNILLDVANSVDATNIAANAVGSSEIVANAVGSSELADNAVDTAAIANNAVTDAKISGMSSSKLLGALPAIDGSSLTNLPAGGKVLQVINAVDTSETSTGSTSMQDTGLTATITPSATSSKVLVSVGMNFGITGSSGGVGSRLMRGSTSIRGASEKSDGHGAGESSYHEAWIAFDYLDTPNTTSATTYKMQFKSNNGGTVFTSIDGNVSTITLMEIGA